MTPLRLCKLRGCEREHTARGLCQRHYDQLMSGRPPGVIHEAKLLTDEPFSIANEYHLALADECSEIDSRVVFKALWQLIGLWHLAGWSPE